ncbi:hypothetical protein [Bradyrhizobium sp. CCGUVB14]|uniref:hypothetical protein n=1 Tax=Bradyrhizobium sp. CCGUVB14 TaxID=2949628 RepID=UPI0020B34453|nr:hypothetical protein [Bradyrhizobium sp. CCGUVB14]MCP3446157.1 hypothetical protein [Bradyrhizobium sp. CCGUVB14]
MPNEVETTELSKIAKLNGDFRRNYGTLLGAFLYLRSIAAAGGRSNFWITAIFAAATAGLAWFEKSWPWVHAN